MSEYTPTDQQVLAALNAWGVINPGEKLSDYADETVDRMRAALRVGYEASEETEWEYALGWIAEDGRARISQGVIAPGYVAEFISEGGGAWFVVASHDSR